MCWITALVSVGATCKASSMMLLKCLLRSCNGSAGNTSYSCKPRVSRDVCGVFCMRAGKVDLSGGCLGLPATDSSSSLLSEFLSLRAQYVIQQPLACLTG